jgi:hypothetical protein
VGLGTGLGSKHLSHVTVHCGVAKPDQGGVEPPQRSQQVLVCAAAPSLSITMLSSCLLQLLFRAVDCNLFCHRIRYAMQTQHPFGCSACQPVFVWLLSLVHMLCVVPLTLCVCRSGERGGALSCIGGSWFGSLDRMGLAGPCKGLNVMNTHLLTLNTPSLHGCQVPCIPLTAVLQPEQSKAQSPARW